VIKDKKNRGKFFKVFWKQNWARMFHNTNREKIGGELGGVYKGFFLGLNLGHVRG